MKKLKNLNWPLISVWTILILFSAVYHYYITFPLTKYVIDFWSKW